MNFVDIFCPSSSFLGIPKIFETNQYGTTKLMYTFPSFFLLFLLEIAIANGEAIARTRLQRTLR